MAKPGKAKGGSLMVDFLTMDSDIHRHSLAVLFHDPTVLHNVRKFQDFSPGCKISEVSQGQCAMQRLYPAAAPPHHPVVGT
jgi:hypothetical protein